MIDEETAAQGSEKGADVYRDSLPIIMDFWAPWCSPCRMVTAMLEKIACECTGRLIVMHVNVDENPEQAAQFGVQVLPTVAFVYRGQVIDHQVGAPPERALREKVQQFLAAASCTDVDA